MINTIKFLLVSNLILINPMCLPIAYTITLYQRLSLSIKIKKDCVFSL